jgi:hypothetical protein
MLFFGIVSCGDNSPFDEDYWDDPGEGDQQERENEIRTYSTSLEPIPQSVPGISGTFSITVTDNISQSTLNLTGIPDGLAIAHRSFSNQSCDSLRTSTAPETPNPSGEIKSIQITEDISRETFLRELNQSSPGNGDDTNLAGRSVVISFYVNETVSPNPRPAALLPLACGELVLGQTDREDDDNFPGGTTTGGIIGGAVGTIDGGANGNTIGVVGGAGGIGSVNAGTNGTFTTGGTSGF